MQFKARSGRVIGVCSCGQEHDLTELVSGTALQAVELYKNLTPPPCPTDEDAGAGPRRRNGGTNSD